MARDVGTFAESKRVQQEMEKRESGYSEDAGTAKLKDAYVGGKTQPTFGSFKKPSIGTVRKHME